MNEIYSTCCMVFNLLYFLPNYHFKIMKILCIFFGFLVFTAIRFTSWKNRFWEKNYYLSWTKTGLAGWKTKVVIESNTKNAYKVDTFLALLILRDFVRNIMFILVLPPSFPTRSCTLLWKLAIFKLSSLVSLKPRPGKLSGYL